MSKSPLFGQNGLRKSAWWRPPDSDKNSIIVKKNLQNVYKVHQCNYSGLFINLGLPGGSFCQKVNFLVKIKSGNQPPVMSPDPDKKSNIVKKVEKMSFKWSKVIISGKTSILAI